jgi:hypothetical protein
MGRRVLVLCLIAALYGVLASVACAATRPPTQPANADGLSCFNGYAYALASGDYRYTAHHEVRRKKGRLTDWDVTYTGRNGQVLARQHMDFSAWQTVPVYRLAMPGSGYAEGIRHDHGQWTMFERASAQAEEQSRLFIIDPPMAADAGLNELVAEHFKNLVSGRSVHFKLAMPGRQSVLDVKIHKTGNTSFEGRPAIELKAELDMFLASWLIRPLELTYDLQTRRLLEYRGIGTLHNDQGNTYLVRVVFPSQMPEVARRHGAPQVSCGS